MGAPPRGGGGSDGCDRCFGRPSQWSWKDPGPPWVEAVTVGYVAAGAVLLAVASPWVAADDGVEAATLFFLTARALVDRRREREKAAKKEEKMRALNTRVSARLPLTDAQWAAWYRWQGIL